jgi:hypothetical protein
MGESLWEKVNSAKKSAMKDSLKHQKKVFCIRKSGTAHFGISDARKEGRNL